MGSESIFKLPVVDLQKETLNPGTNSWIEARKLVTQALEDYGCFLAMHDKFSAGFNDAIFAALHDLFDLPTEIKAKNPCQIPFFGYSGPNAFMPLHESTGIEDTANLKSLQSFTDLMWPSGNNHFSEIFHSYSMKLMELEEMVSRMAFESYGVEKYLESHLKSRTSLLRFMKYRVPEQNEMNFGMGAHTDKNFMTILQNQVDGLEVQLKDGNWISVDFPPSSLIVMAGDAFSAWSNGRVRAALHRVTMNGKEPRYSVAQFIFSSGMVRSPEELVDDDHPLLYKPFDNFGLLRFLATEEGRKADSTLKAYCGV